MNFYWRIQQGWLLLRSVEQLCIGALLVFLLGDMLADSVQHDASSFTLSLILFVVAGFISGLLCIIAQRCELD